MNFRPRYNLIASAALCIMASCTADDIAGGAAASDAAMEFSVGAEVRSSSEADNLRLSPFSVFSDIYNSSCSAPLTMMVNVPLTYNHDDNRWEYSGQYYWFPSFEHSFVAVSPAPVVNTVEAGTGYSDSRLKFTYTLPADRSQIIDLFAATHRRKYAITQEKPDVVCLQFSHILSKINLAGALVDEDMNRDDFIEFSNIELIGFNTTGTYNITPAPLQSNKRTDDCIVEMTELSGNGYYVINFDTPKKIVNNGESVKFLDDSNAIMILPQTFALTSDARIRLTYTVNGSEYVNTVDIPLAGNNWAIGRSYLYKFTISKWGLKLIGTTIVDWNEKNFDMTLTVDKKPSNDY